MADGHFPTLVSKDRLSNAQTNAIWVSVSDQTNALAIDGSGFITANINGTVTVSVSGSVTVTATQLDIDDLSHTTDSVSIGDGTDLLAIAADGSIAVTDNGTTLSIDDGAGSITVDGTVAATQSGTWNIGTLTSITNDVNIADGGNSITVDATDLDIRALDHVTIGDSVRIGDGTETLAVNTDGSINVNIVSAVSANEVNDYDTTSAVASDTADNHDYTVVNTTMLLTSVIASCSGGMKYEVQVGPVASLVTKAVGFIPKQGGTDQLFFDPPIEVPVTSTGTVRIIRTNRQGTAVDVYSTIIGRDI